MAVYRLHRAWHYGLNYYFGRELPEWSRTAPPGSVIVASDAGVEELQTSGLPVQVLERVSEEAVIVAVMVDGSR